MNELELFECFSQGSFCMPNEVTDFNQIEWTKHPKFEGVELKHILTGKHTEGQFSFHLVRIAENMKIGLHIHESQIETHEVIAGDGICFHDGKELTYEEGVITLFPKGIQHEVVAGNKGLFLFAKFFPALC